MFVCLLVWLFVCFLCFCGWLLACLVVCVRVCVCVLRARLIDCLLVSPGVCVFVRLFAALSVCLCVRVGCVRACSFIGRAVY